MIDLLLLLTMLGSMLTWIWHTNFRRPYGWPFFFFFFFVAVTAWGLLYGRWVL